MSKTINIGTTYKGKEISIIANGIKNETPIPVEKVVISIDVPSGVAFKSASIPYGSFNPTTQKWTIDILYPDKEPIGEFRYEITNECLSQFVFTLTIDSEYSCQSCDDAVSFCYVVVGTSCCELSRCKFTRVSFESVDAPCLESPVAPVSPPAEPIEGEMYVEVYQDCETWWQYVEGVWVLINNPTSPSGTISQVTPVVSGQVIATHDNGVDPPVDIEESVINVTGVITGGHSIANIIDETGAPHNIRETITEFNNTVAGHKIADFTDEANGVTDINETVTAYSNLVVSGNKIGEHTNEEGTVTDVEETITSLAENTDLSLTYTDEAGTPITSTSPMVKPVRYESADYVVNGTTDYTIFGGGACESITLPDPALVPEGRIFNIKQGQKTGNFITVTAANGGTIDEVAFYQFTVIYESISVQRFSTGYIII